MKFVLILFSIFMFTGCALFQPTKHDRMVKQLQNYQYSMSPAELKTQIYNALEKQNTFSESKMIILTTGANEARNVELQGRAKEAMDNGFTYDQKLYKAKEFSIGFADLFSPENSGHLKNKLDEVIKTGDVHLVKDSPEEVIFVKGATVITLKQMAKDQTSLSACTLNYVERGPLKLGFDMVDYISEGFDFLGALRLRQGPVILEKSMQYCAQDRSTELALFYHLVPGVAQAWESKIQ